MINWKLALESASPIIAIAAIWLMTKAAERWCPEKEEEQEEEEQKQFSWIKYLSSDATWDDKTFKVCAVAVLLTTIGGLGMWMREEHQIAECVVTTRRLKVKDEAREEVALDDKKPVQKPEVDYRTYQLAY